MSLARLAPLLLALALLACGPKVVREPVHESEQVHVSLRRLMEEGVPRARGHAHPVVVSDVRLAHVLASISHRDGKDRSVPTVRSEHVYELAEGLRKALAQAGPDDEVLAAVEIGDRRLGLFSDDKVTAFRVTFDSTFMRIEFFEIERPLERETGRAEPEGYDFPLEPPKASPRFKLIPAAAQTLEGSRTVLVDWRDPYYSRPMNLNLRGGRAQRRTLLLQAEPESEAPLPPPSAEVPPELRDAQLRALDQLDGARRSGLLTEAEFQRRRRLVLEGKLEEAGYPVP
jgi:hypothetical protein